MDIIKILNKAGFDLIADLVGYETLVRVILENNILELEGDFIEIGVFLGGGTRKLARLAQTIQKKVICIDPFQLSNDKNVTENGERFSDIYKNVLADIDISLSQKEIFEKVTKNEKNIKIIQDVSQNVSFDKNQKFCFGFIDGEHSYSAVQSDFNLVWNRTVCGGIVGLHDYGGDIADITRCIDNIIKQYGIKEYIVKPSKRLIFLKKV